MKLIMSVYVLKKFNVKYVFKKRKRNFSEPMKPMMGSQATGATALQPVRERRRVLTLATTLQTWTNTGPWNSLIFPAGEVEFVILTTLLQAVFYLKKQTNFGFPY